jgi:hypothetical protein
MAAERVEDWNFDLPPSPTGVLPTDVLTMDETVRLVNGSTLVLKHHPSAHTDGDSHHCRGRYHSYRRHLLERDLSVHRLLDRRDHRWDDPCGQRHSRSLDRLCHHCPRTWPSGQQHVRTQGVSRHARGHPRKGGRAQGARAVSG